MNTATANIQFAPSGEGRYTVAARFVKWDSLTRIIVEKQESLNPSARGGAYMTEWVARHGLDIARGETRTAAVEALLRNLNRDRERIRLDEEA